MKEMRIRVYMTEGFLGTKSGTPELLRDYIVAKNPNSLGEDELELNIPKDVDEELTKGTTFFNRTEDGQPFIFDYQVKGFFKDAQGVLNRMNKMPAYKKIIDGLIFVKERKIMLQMPEGEEMGICERPLRAPTPQGERVAIARSEEAPAGTVLEFTIQVLDDKLMKNVKEWLDYGILRGLGQWRNSGKGRFSWEEIK
jgi:hypothetical protein